MGVYRQPSRIRPHLGVRTLTWREPGPQAGYPDVGGQGIIYTGTGLSIQRGASPPVQIGDTVLTGNTTPGLYTVQVNPDGTIVVSLGGDTSRQEIPFLLYRRITGTFDGPGLIILNEAPPVWNSVVSVRSQLVNTALSSINLSQSTYITSPSGDVLTFALASGALPNGVSLSSGGLISGTPTLIGSFAFTVSATDSTGTSTTSPSMGITVVAPPPPGPVLPPGPTLLAPPPDTAGAKIDAQIAVLQQLVNDNTNSLIEYQLQQALNQFQVEAVDHYMSTGWANAAAILALFPAPAWDHHGQDLTARILFLQNAYNNAPSMPPGNVNGYGGSGWTTIAASLAQRLYAAQTALVDYLMQLPGGTAAATILSGMTGVQTDPGGIPYQYKFSSVGFTDPGDD